MVSRRGMLAVAAATATTPVTAACSRPQPAYSRPPDDVRMLSGFGILGREAAPWVADAKGFFAAQGLRVTIHPGQAGDFNLKALEAGQVDFTVLDFAKALTLQGAGHHSFMMVAAVQQDTIVALMSLPGRGITTPTDLPGHTLQQAPNTVVKLLFNAFGKLAGFDPRRVRWAPDVAPNLLPTDLVAHKVDAIGQFIPGAPSIKAAAGGQTPIVLPYSNYLTDLFGNVLVAASRLVASNPGLVARFVTGFLQGLRYAVNHPAEGGAIIQTASRGQATAAVAAEELTLMRPYTQPDSAHFGLLDPTRVSRGIALLQGLGVVPGGLTPDTVLAPARALPSHA